MGATTPDPGQLETFRDRRAFETWMRRNHATAPEIWIRVYKKGSGVKSIAIDEALDVALCWGWIDGIRRGYDAESYLQRYTPRRPKSLWSQVNRNHVARLIEAGRMTPAGLAEIERAKKDGRWDAAYAPMRSAGVDAIPPDLRAAIDANPKALATFLTLSKQNLFVLTFRTNNMKTAAGRARKIVQLVEMLERGETIIPQRPKASVDRARP
jgi:uncharacterized protein YdeI (YjbR/CyaY-like superfamily)